MTTTLQKIQNTITNPFLSNAREWFASGTSGLYNVIGSRASMSTGTTEPWRITKLSKADAHFVTSGLDILDILTSKNRTADATAQACEIFEKSSALQGWELCIATTGATHIVGPTGRVISFAPVSATKDEVAYLNDLPEMVRYLLSQ